MTVLHVGMHQGNGVSELHHIDLNLLVALDALLSEQSVTKAAQRTGVSQSAMSHTLRRARELFDDPLLVRGGGGMVLTPRAESVVVPLRSALVSLARTLVQPAEFDATQAQRTFTVVSPDLFDVLVLPGVLRRIGTQAPGINVTVGAAYARLSQRLETGDVDLAILPVLLGADAANIHFGARPDPDLRQRTLFHDRFRCFLRRDHPALTKARKLSARKFTALGHVLVSPSGEGPGVVDRVLEGHGLQRRVALRVPQFSTALAIVAQSDLVLTAPNGLAGCANAAELVCLAPPVALPEHAVTMVWHPRFTEDPPHRWLRELVAQVATGVAATMA